LCPSETYPCERLATEEFKEEPTVMKDMPQMANFVYEMYMSKMRTMAKEEAANVPKVI